MAGIQTKHAIVWAASPPKRIGSIMIGCVPMGERVRASRCSIFGRPTVSRTVNSIFVHSDTGASVRGACGGETKVLHCIVSSPIEARLKSDMQLKTYQI